MESNMRKLTSLGDRCRNGHRRPVHRNLRCGRSLLKQQRQKKQEKVAKNHSESTKPRCDLLTVP